MNYKQARIFFTSIIIIFVLLIVWLLIPHKCQPQCRVTPSSEVAGTPEPKPSAPEVRIVSLRISERVGNLSRQFADLNPEHLVYAERLGIRPIASTRDIMRLKRPIVKVESNAYHHIDDLSHSYPYLVPQAAELLDTIGARFNRKLSERGGGNYKIKVTSLLRTRESVNRLRHGNINSTENSAHLYGTTFDISYVEFREGMFNTKKHTDGELKNLLAEVLLELRDAEKCLVKFERKQGCFHITATGR